MALLRSNRRLERQRLKLHFWRRILRLRYLLFQRHRHDRLRLEKAAGYPLLLLPQVFNPALFRTGAFLAGALSSRLVPPGSRVLDMGSGSGIGAVAAAQWAAQVIAVDINPAAVRCTRINTLLNGVEDRVVVREGDLFAPVQGERFDVVLFNPPYYAGEPRNALDRAFYAPDVAERFAAGLAHYLTPSGYALVLLSTDGQPAAFLRAFEAYGHRVRSYARKDCINEVLTIYQVDRLAPGSGHSFRQE